MFLVFLAIVYSSAMPLWVLFRRRVRLRWVYVYGVFATVAIVFTITVLEGDGLADALIGVAFGTPIAAIILWVAFRYFARAVVFKDGRRLPW